MRKFRKARIIDFMVSTSESNYTMQINAGDKGGSEEGSEEGRHNALPDTSINLNQKLILNDYLWPDHTDYFEKKKFLLNHH